MTDAAHNKEHTLIDSHSARAKAVSPLIQAAKEQKYLHDDNPLLNLFHYDAYIARLHALQQSFSSTNKLSFNHALAVKANPTPALLRKAAELGFGAECASYAEVTLALATGFPPREIVYDSPCKTRTELKSALLAGVYINLDSEDEISKLKSIIAELEALSVETKEKILPKKYLKAQIGLRINPIVGSGGIASSSTATSDSKFGVPFTETSVDHLVRLFRDHEWLQGLHVHVGSQGCSLELLAHGARGACDCAKMIHEALDKEQISVIDIGGGIGIAYDGKQNGVNVFEQYHAILRAKVPELFEPPFVRVITEFGRSVFVKPGITISKVEAVKCSAGGQQIAIIHVGADQFLRTALMPDVWPHVITILASDGSVKHDAPYICQDIAGPLCFSGDFLTRKSYLPSIQTGDIVVIHDTGGYTSSMFSRYNSRQAAMSLIYTIDQQQPAMYQFAMLRDRESIQETLQFWGPLHSQILFRS